MTSIHTPCEDPDWMFRSFNLSKYYTTGINDNCGDGDDE